MRLSILSCFYGCFLSSKSAMIRTREFGISAICFTPLIFLVLSFCQEIHSSIIQIQPNEKKFDELIPVYLPSNSLSFNESNSDLPLVFSHEYPMILVFLSKIGN